MSDNDFIIIDEEKETRLLKKSKRLRMQRRKKYPEYLQKRNTRMSTKKFVLYAIGRRA